MTGLRGCFTLAVKFDSGILSLNETLAKLKAEKSLEVGLEVASALLALLGDLELKSTDEVIDTGLLKLPNSERQDPWFHQHPWMRGERSAFELLDSEVLPIQAKFYWVQKGGNAYVAGAVHFTKNWEDHDFTRTDDFKIGIDFFLTPDASSVLVVLSNRGNLRVLELSEKLTNTQLEILQIWVALKDATERAQLHAALWESFRLQSVNAKFYNGVSDAFNELCQHLSRQQRSEEDAKLFASRLLGRLIFIWFLRKKKLINEEINYFDTPQPEQDYYRNFLEHLFFGTLNTPLENRTPLPDGRLDLVTPHLNGGLFAPHADDWVGDVGLTFPTAYFARLFQHFNDFNFTTDESTPEYEQVAIDPEMLGRVFESLLASQIESTGAQARKAKGTFYTPREIVSFMCRESLRCYLESLAKGDERLKNAVSKLIDTSDQEWTLAGTNSLRDIPTDLRPVLSDALERVTAIDPACGSGAFPMGMLGALLQLRQRLEPKSDRHLLKYSILKTNIFGVDIEPMAIEISRLRAWLALIVDADSSKPIDPLPNLDFRFVCANSLLPLTSREDDIGLFDDEDIESHLMSIRSTYFSSTDMKQKAALKAQYQELIEVGPDSFDGARSRQLKSYNPFDYELPADFFDPTTMFGSEATFDIVIGNPPYISALAAKKQMSPRLRDKYKSIYECAAGAYDMYILFFERGLQLAGTSGVLTYITPTKYLSAKYAEAFRAHAANSLKLVADFDNKRVFESAGVSTLISMFKEDQERESIEVLKFSETIGLGAQRRFFPASSLKEFPEDTWGHLKWGDYSLLSRIHQSAIKLESVATVVASTTAAEADEYARFVTNEYQPSSFKKVNTGNIAQVFPLWGIKDYSNKKQKIREPYLPQAAANERRRQMFAQEKIIISKLSKRLTAMYDVHGHYASSNTVLVLNPVQPFSTAALAAILNSKLMQYIYASVFSGLNLLGSFQFQAPQIRLLPVPKNPEIDCLKALEYQIQRLDD